jgi:uncharacterized protein (TIGR03437 family)
MEPLKAQFVPQGTKLSGSDASLPSYLGSAVALSSDGSTALVGGYLDGDSRGAAWVYTRTSGEWTQRTWIQQGLKLVGANCTSVCYQGIRVGLSADGNTAILGGDGDAGGVGAAWIFVRSSDTWIQQRGKLVGSGAIGNAAQGLSVALSGDGNTAIVGGALDNNFRGGAWVWTRSNGGWNQQSKLIPNDAQGQAEFGFSTALSYDGNTALVGAWLDYSNVGAAWVFVRDAIGNWSQQGNKLVGAGAEGLAQQGWSVALSADGNTALVHGAADAGYAGAAWVWVRKNGTWSQQGTKLVGVGLGLSPAKVDQGQAVALSADGNIAALGRAADSGSVGGVWLFARSSDGSWSPKGSSLVGSGAVGAAMQGYSVALSADGTTLMEGGPLDDSRRGAAWVFAENPVKVTSVRVASGGDTLAPNAWVEIKGSGLAPSSVGPAGLTWSQAPEFAQNKMPTQLQNVSVTANGKPAYIWFISAAQVNALLPLDLAAGAVHLQVTNGSVASSVFDAVVAPVSPAFLLMGASKEVAAIHADGSLAGATSLSAPGYPFTPVKPGETIVLYGTGFGLPAAELTAGSATQFGMLPTLPVIRIGGIPASVAFAGVVSPGLYQFNVVVPAGVPDGENAVSATYGVTGTSPVSTPVGAQIAVSRPASF